MPMPEPPEIPPVPMPSAPPPDTKPVPMPTYRYVGAYPCAVDLPAGGSAVIAPGAEIEWPDGPPNSLWWARVIPDNA